MLHLSSKGQINVAGKIMDKDENEPLAGASVIIKDQDGKIQKFTTSNGDGEFSMIVTSLKRFRLEVSMIGYAKNSIPLDSISFPIIVQLEPGKTLLKEVKVKAERIREQGDTITYNVGSFAQKQDRSIGDVMSRMPGINVEKSGKIQYQGEDINKFYIEGSDLLGGKYGIATNGISHEDVGAVEVMENHQPMQVLTGISYSDKAAINLKLKNKAKATWSFHGDAGGGYSWQPEGTIWDGEIFAMAVLPGFQNITSVKTNNIGEDLSAQATDFFATRRGTSLNRYIEVSLPSVPRLNEKRTLFNRSTLITTNNLWKKGRGEFKVQIDYSFNRVLTVASNITTYFLNDGEQIVTESQKGVERSNSLSAKVIYESNQKTAFINNTLKTNIDWDNVRLGMTGSIPNDQRASLPDYYVDNSFNLIKRFKGKHLVTFISKNEWESLPQIFTVSKNNGYMSQQVNDQAFYTNESAAYAFLIKGVTFSLEGGIKGYFRSLNTQLPELPDELPGMTTNVLNTNYFTLFTKPKIEYWVKRVNFSLDAPLSFANYTFNKVLANRSEVYFSPSLSMNWKPNNRFELRLRGGNGRSPMDLNLIHPGFVMTSYRSFRSGVDDFYNRTSQNISANLSYKHTRRGVFANAFLMQSWNQNPYTLSQLLYGDYVIYSYTGAKSDSKMFMVNGNIGKTLDFMRGSTNITGSFSRNESLLLSESQRVSSVGSTWSAKAVINGSPVSWLSLDYRFNFSASRLGMNGINANWLSSIQNELLLNLSP